MAEQKCPICGLEASAKHSYGYSHDCPKCGKYSFSDRHTKTTTGCFISDEEQSPSSALSRYIKDDKDNPIRFSHFLAMQQEAGEDAGRGVFLETKQIRKIYRDQKHPNEHPGLQLPTPADQMDLVILWLGKQPAGQWCYPKYCRGEAIIGAVSDDNFEFIIDGLSERNLVENGERKTDNRDPERKLTLRLTLRGWDRFRELRLGQIAGD